MFFFVYAHPLGPDMAQLTEGFFVFPCDLGRGFGWRQLNELNFETVVFGNQNSEGNHPLWCWMKRDAATMLRDDVFQRIIDSFESRDYLCTVFNTSNGLLNSTLRIDANTFLEIRPEEMDKFAEFLLQTMTYSHEDRVAAWNGTDEPNVEYF